MSLLLRFLQRRGRTLILLGIAGVVFGVWLGIWVRVLPLKPLASWSLPEKPGFSLRVVEFSADGSVLVMADASGRTEVWDIATASLRTSILPNMGYVTEIAVSPDGRLLVLKESAGLLTVFDTRLGEEVAALPANCDDNAPPGSLFVFSPDARTLAYCFPPELGEPGAPQPAKSVIVWDTALRKARFTLAEQADPLCLSADGTRLATISRAGDSRGNILVWDLKTGQRLGAIAPGHDSIQSLAFTPDGTTLVLLITYPPEELRPTSRFHAEVWDIGTSTRRMTVERTGQWKLVAFQPQWACRLLPDGRLCWTGTNASESIERYEFVDLITGVCEWSHDVSEMQWDVQMDPTGRWLAHLEPADSEAVLGSNWLSSEPHGSLDPFSHQRLRITSIPDGRSVCLPVGASGAYIKFSADGNLLARIDLDGRIEVWSLPPRRPTLYLIALSAVPTVLFTALGWWRWGR